MLSRLSELKDRLPSRPTLSPNVHGWLICFAVLIVTVVRSGITYSFGVFVVKLTNDYHRSLAEQNWVGTLSFCVSLSFSPVSVALIRVVGPHGFRIVGLLGVVILSVSCIASSLVTSLEWMFLTHSLLYGVGSSFIYMASSLIIGDYFDKDHPQHVLATSILLCGYPVGSLVFNPINAWLVNSYGWRIAFRAASGMIFIVGICCVATFAPKRTPAYYELNDEEKTKDISLKGCFGSCVVLKQRPEILLWLFGNMLSYLGFYMPFLNLPYYMKLKGITALDSSWALTVLSLGECISYVIASLVGVFFRGKLVFSNILASFALAVICIVWPFVDASYAEIMVISAVMGTFLGLTIVYAYAASGEVTGLSLDVAWALTNMWSGFGILLGPFFSGLIYDLRRSYDDVFYVNGGIFAVDLLVFGAVAALQKYRQYKGQFEYEEIDGDSNLAASSSEDYERTFRSVKKSMSRPQVVDEASIEYYAHED